MNPGLFLFILASLIFLPDFARAECRQWVNGYTKKNGTQVKGYYRTCPDGDKSNNYGSPGYKGEPPRERDADGDGIPNYRDRDDNNNGIGDNYDPHPERIYNQGNPREVIIPRYRHYKRVDDFPVIREQLPPMIIYLPRGGSYYRTTRMEWDIFGNCVERAANGIVLGSVARDYCRQEVGSQYDWDIFGNCQEKTPNGTVIQSVDRNVCRAYMGRYFDWDIFGNCQEKTPAGVVIQSVNRDTCRIAIGSMYEFDIFGNCKEKTPDGTVIQGVDRDYCRYRRDYLPGQMQSMDYREKHIEGAGVSVEIRIGGGLNAR